jgi:peptide/nickel transport system ATP-binding protein
VSCLETRNLSVSFAAPEGRLTAVDRVSLDLCGGGESLALVGETGCGKSTLALAAQGLLPPNAEIRGEVLFDGLDLLKLSERERSRIRGGRIATVLQNPSLSLNPVYPVGRQVAEVFRIHRGTSRREAERQAADLLARLGIGNAEREMAQYPFQFSEGMNQRVLIAAGVALDPRVLIADEPTKGLDRDLKQEIIEEFRLIQEGGRTALFLIAHDLEAAARLCGRFAVMYAGEIVEESGTEVFFAGPLHPYSRALLNSLPDKGFEPIRGNSPSLIRPPRGCRFHPRCLDVMDACREERPEMNPDGTGRTVRCHLYR